jgi:outer membrane protein assembly factor BamD
MLRRLAVFLIGVSSLAGVAWGTERRTWEFENGSWVDVLPEEATPKPINDPILDRAEQLLANGQFKAARDILVPWIKAHTLKETPGRDRCLYLLADCFYQYDDRNKAFFYCDELMDEYPGSKLFQAALQLQFTIGDAYLNGYKRVFLWWRVVDASDDGIEMMYRIQERAPGSPLAEKALLHTANYYFDDQDYDLAEDAYNTYARRYPRSDQLPHIRMRAAFSSLAQFRGVPFDVTCLIDARAQLIDIAKTYPDLAEDENVAGLIDQIDRDFAKKLLDTAKWYERTHEPKGAVYFYRFLVQTYPNSPEAAEARERLSELPERVLAEGDPPAATGYAPSTQPAAGLDLR